MQGAPRLFQHRPRLKGSLNKLYIQKKINGGDFLQKNCGKILQSESSPGGHLAVNPSTLTSAVDLLEVKKAEANVQHLGSEQFELITPNEQVRLRTL